MSIKDYTLIYEGLSTRTTPDKVVTSASITVYSDEKLVAGLTPERYLHRSYKQPVTEVAIHSTLKEDLYVILGGWDEDGTGIFKVLVNPLVNWIWIGGATLLLGSVLVFWPDRRQIPEHAGSVDDRSGEG